jgi:1-acyl-sn-glycerol-3-phosphate acyltransferase
MRTFIVVVFNTVFYTVLAFGMILILPLFFFSRHVVLPVLMTVMGALMGLQNLFGQKVEFRGLHNIPHGGCLIAPKHQSMWETMILGTLFDDPGFIYKRELEKIPLFGIYLRKFDMVPIDRAKGASELRKMTRLAAQKVKQGRQIIIFPEGTRREPGAEPAYKPGIALLYEAANAPVVPIALNSGVFWSKYLWRGKTGKLIVELLPSIPPGLSREEFMDVLQTQLEAATDRILHASPPL